MHPLERPVWSALTSRQAAIALGDHRARRFAPDTGMFAAAADAAPENLAALARFDGPICLMELAGTLLPPGRTVLAADACHQMLAPTITTTPEPPGLLALTDADAADMQALAALTKPGPFFARTNRLGRFIGIRQAGRLIAMAGERMQPTGFTEVSGVCTDPDHRGQGYARALIATVASRILARGDTPFLHTYASNTGAIALYEQLGFRTRREIIMTMLAPDENAPSRQP
jgi:ribosomal protein S18 acetylase RimI-like enzyme